MHGLTFDPGQRRVLLLVFNKRHEHLLPTFLLRYEVYTLENLHRDELSDDFIKDFHKSLIRSQHI